jgi:hypothetical protein
MFFWKISKLILRFQNFGYDLRGLGSYLKVTLRVCRHVRRNISTSVVPLETKPKKEDEAQTIIYESMETQVRSRRLNPSMANPKKTYQRQIPNTKAKTD